MGSLPHRQLRKGTAVPPRELPSSLELNAKDPQGFILEQEWAGVSLDVAQGLEEEIAGLKAEAGRVAEEARELAGEVPF